MRFCMLQVKHLFNLLYQWHMFIIHFFPYLLLQNINDDVKPDKAGIPRTSSIFQGSRLK